MADIYIVTKDNCKYCDQLKDILSKYEVRFNEMNLNNIGLSLDQMKDYLRELKTGSLTLPQVFFNGEFFGGFAQVKQSHEEGKLAEILNTRFDTMCDEDF